MSSTVTPETQPKKKPLWRRLLPLMILAVLFGGFFALDLGRFVSFDALRENRAHLQDFVTQHAILAVLIYMVMYAAMVSASLPGATVFTVAGGFLFGSVLATLYTVVAATVGATVIFLVAKTALGDVLREKAGKRLEKLLSGFRQDAFNYLLVLRLVPIFPFFLVNVAPAFAGVPLRVYVLATFLGIIPGTFVYAQVGTGLGSLFDSGQTFTLGGVLTPEIIIALVGLAVLSVIPVVYKRVGRRRLETR
jgi:uncharacterized membrane protein YdjX (TVP38/TMEM64 family)